jgi:hypothetical protein
MSSHVPSYYENSRKTISKFSFNVRRKYIDRNNLYACDGILGYSKFHSIHAFSIFDPN